MAGTMKGRYFGGGMMVAPGQDRESGKISIMAMHGGSRAKTLGVFLKIFKGTHVKHKEMIDIFEGNEVTVEFETPSDMQIDGETVADVLSYRVRLNAAAEVEAAEALAEA
jgi:diacylglycerol kinase family enzyme